MVFRDSLKEPKMKVEGAEYESPVMAGLQGHVSLQPPVSFNHNLRVSQDDWHILAYILSANKTNVKGVGKGLLNKEMCALTFGYIGLNGKKPILVARSGENHDGQASDNSLLPGLNDDMALDILARSSRSDYPNLACLNRKFRSLISSGCLYKLRRQLDIIEHWVYLACTMMPWEAFDPMRECPLMNLPRCLFGSSNLGEIALVAGESDKNGNVLKSAELYNSELDCLTCGEEYNIETRSWRRIENMYPGCNAGTFHTAMRSPPLVAVVNNQLYSADQLTNEVKKYDKVNNSWNAVKRIPVRADSSNGWGLAFKACGNSLLVIGAGGRDDGVIVLHSWDPEEGNGNGPEWNVLAVKERAGRMFQWKEGRIRQIE
ncbi:hypothetical protein CRYUN_Cryun16bG0049700 [Craigia yunnanensis]